MQVNTKIDRTLPRDLGNLPQDPDVVLVGEIVDPETEYCGSGILTGHLCSPRFAPTTRKTFGRLTDMGVEPFLIASSVVACMAQRLLRRVCPHCREQYEPRESELEQLGLLAPQSQVRQMMLERFPSGKPTFYRAVGCEECGHSGYSGRSAIYELLVVSDEIRSLVTKNVEASLIKRAAVKEGMLSLMDDGARKVLDGITTAEEVFRVATATDEVF